jgi:hypothetical protein
MAQNLVHASDAVQLADMLERILDKGVVVAADIRINLLDIELLTINIRLLVASVERAREMGIDWWEHSPFLTERAAEKELKQALGEKEREVLKLKSELTRITQGSKTKSVRSKKSPKTT